MPQDPNKEFEYYKCSPSLYIKVHYIYFSQEELWNRYENVINKVGHNLKLTEMEALDIAFVSKFISKKHASKVIESLTKAFRDAKIDDGVLKTDVGVILGGMILKHFNDIEKQNKLMGMINMRHIEREIDKIVYDEYGEILDKKDEEIKTKTVEIEAKDREISKLNKSNNEYKDKIKQLHELGDLNSPEAKKIINSLILL